MNRIAITRVSFGENKAGQHLAYIELTPKREFNDFMVFCEENSLLGSVYIGRVENIIENIGAAFVRILPDQICYLPLEGIKHPLYRKKQSQKKTICIGDEIAVQVTKDAIKTKDPVIDTKLTLAGNYCMLTTNNLSFGISKKIQGEKRGHLEAFLKEFEPFGTQNGFGLILRTNSIEASPEVLRQDVENVIANFEKMKQSILHGNGFSCLYHSEPSYIQKLKSVDLKNVEEIITDEEDIWQEMCQRLPYLKEKGKLKKYTDPAVSLSTLYHIRGSLDTLVQKRVWLKSGANIIIEQLETLTVIDVNSGKNLKRSSNIISEINCEAAREVARQLRLRNISGMILIDFVNDEDPDSMEKLIAFLKAEIAKDSIPTQFIDVTKLGLVELTRKKVRKSLRETLEL